MGRRKKSVIRKGMRCPSPAAFEPAPFSGEEVLSLETLPCGEPSSSRYSKDRDFRPKSDLDHL